MRRLSEHVPDPREEEEEQQALNPPPPPRSSSPPRSLFRRRAQSCSSSSGGTTNLHLHLRPSNLLHSLKRKRRHSQKDPAQDQDRDQILLSTMPAQQIREDVKGKLVASGALPYNPSSQHLMAKTSDSDLAHCYTDAVMQQQQQQKRRHQSGLSHKATPNHISRRQWTTVAVLFFVNLINYMDRLTIAGTKEKKYKTKTARSGANVPRLDSIHTPFFLLLFIF